MFYSGFDALFSILFPLVFLFVLGMILFTVASNLRTWSKNNASPRLTVPATVVAKRMNISRHHTANAGDMTGAHGCSQHERYYLLCDLSGGKRRPHGAAAERHRIRPAGRRRHRKAELSGHALSGV